MIDLNMINYLLDAFIGCMDSVIDEAWEVNGNDKKLADELRDEIYDSINEVCEKFIADNNITDKGWRAVATFEEVPPLPDLSAEECKKAFEYAKEKQRERVEELQQIKKAEKEKIEKEKKEAESKFKNNALNELNDLLKSIKKN